MEHAIGIASDHHSGGIVFQVNLDAGLTDRARWSFTCRLFLKASLPGRHCTVRDQGDGRYAWRLLFRQIGPP